MTKQFVMENKKKELDAQLKQVKIALAKERARCFEILNGTEAFKPKFNPVDQTYLDEFDSLCEYLGIDPNNIPTQVPTKTPTKNVQQKSPISKRPGSKSQMQKPSAPPEIKNDENPLIDAYYDRMEGLLQKERSKKDIIKKLNDKLKVLQRQNDALANEKTTKIATLDKSFNALKDQIKETKNFFEDFIGEIKVKINLAKKTVRQAINNKKNDAQSKIKSLDQNIKELQDQKGSIKNGYSSKLSKLSIQTMQDQSVHYVYSDDKIKKIYLNSSKEIQTRYNERLKAFNLKFNNDFLNPINNLIQKTSSLTSKCNKLRDERKQRLSKVIISNWGIMASTLLKKTRKGQVTTSIDDCLKEMQKEDEDLIKELAKEKELANQKIEGTDLTILELRKEVVRLTGELSTLATEKSNILKKMHSDYDQLKETMQKQIEELEAQIT